MPTFPFLVGYMRSGTTLLRAMLDAHPSVAVPDESYFVVSLARRRRRYERPRGFATQRFVDDLLANVRFQRWGLPAAALRPALERPPVVDYADAIRRVFAAYAAQYGKPRFADKTPAYLLQIPLLATLFPESRFVHLIRDGRDVALAARDVPFGEPDVGQLALAWRQAVTRGRAAGAALGPTRYREVHYEQLVRAPERVLHGICEFLELPYDEAMLRYPETAARLLERSVYPQHHQHLLSPPTPNLRDWRTQLAPEDAALFEALAGRMLVDLGYPLAGADPPSRVTVTRARARHGARALVAGAHRHAPVILKRARRAW